jgi:hypothetical protein
MIPLFRDGKKEIIELHEFFEAWFNAKLDNTEENFARFDRVLADGFTLISPGGDLLSRKDILSLVLKAYGLHQQSDPPIRIWIKNVSLVHKSNENALFRYEEWQEVDKQETARVSTVLFQRDIIQPNNLIWSHVHETWMPGKEPKPSSSTNDIGQKKNQDT